MRISMSPCEGWATRFVIGTGSSGGGSRAAAVESSMPASVRGPLMRRLCFLLLACCAPLLALEEKKDQPKAKRAPVKLTEEAQKIPRDGFVFDGHNDLPWRFREKADLSFEKIDLNKHQKDLHTD